jgi:hypothetical protein
VRIRVKSTKKSPVLLSLVGMPNTIKKLTLIPTASTQNYEYIQIHMLSLLPHPLTALWGEKDGGFIIYRS